MEYSLIPQRSLVFLYRSPITYFTTQLIAMYLQPLLYAFFLAIAAPILSPRQFNAVGTYTPGTFSVTASNSPFLTYNNNNSNQIQWYLQEDGNFVVYALNTSTGVRTVEWSSQTAGHDCSTNSSSCSLIFQTDGNLVLYVSGSATWSTSSSGTGAKLLFYPAYLGGTIL